MSETATTDTEVDTGPAPEAAVPAGLATLRGIAARAALPDGWVLAQLEASATARQATDAALDAVAAARPQRPATVSTYGAGPSLADPSVRMGAMQAALAHRMGAPAPGQNDPARQFLGLTASAMWREELAARGVRNAHRLPTEALTRATADIGGMLTTSDYPALLSGAGSRVLAAAYQAAQSPLRQLAAVRTVPDFRTYTTVSSASFPPLELVPEHGEITHGTLAMGAETAKVETFARRVALTRQALVNDDLGMFARAAAGFGKAAADAEARELLRLLLQNGWLGPVMSDGKTLIHADHGNLGTGTTGTMQAASITAARVAMRRQVDHNSAPVGVTPRFLVIPPELEAAAEALVVASPPGTTNPLAGKLEILVEPLFATPGRWWLFGDLPVLEVAYLDGRPLVPELQGAQDRDTLGIDFTIVHDFGCGVTDWRGVWRSAEAA
jgi:hypothetical protein